MIVEEDAWVDMSAFEIDDPEDAVSEADLETLRDALAVDGSQQPDDAMWEHMLSTAISGDTHPATDEADTVDAHDEPEPVEDEVVDPAVAPPESWAAKQPVGEDDPDHVPWHDDLHHGDGP